MNFFNKFNKLKNKNFKTNITKILSISIFALLFITIGTSYAYLTYGNKGTLINTVSSGNLELTLDNETSTLSLNKAVPQLDDDALENNGEYTFTLKNTGNVLTHYEIYLNSICSIEETYTVNGSSIKPDVCVSDNYVKVGVKEGNNDYTILNFEENKVTLDMGEMWPDEEKNYTVKIWLDVNTPNEYNAYYEGEERNVLFASKINVIGEQREYREKQTVYKTMKEQVQTANISYKYINNANVTENGITYNNNDNGVFLYNGTDDNGGNKPIYYYRGNVTNNNVIFGGFCWKIVRTTSTGGTKLIYNGVPFDEYESYDKLNESSYIVTTNTPTDYSFTFDTSTKEWSSGIAGQASTTNTIEFTVTEAGDYALNYIVGSDNSDKVSFYKNGTALASNISGENQTGSLYLTGLTTSDVIKATYTKDRYFDINGDKVSFSIAKGIGEKTLSCNNAGAASRLSSTSEFNTNDSSPADLGYMYGKRYETAYKDMSNITDTYKYGNDVTYSNGTYTLTGKTMDSSSWSTDRTTLADGYHYTCLNSTGTCEEVYYIEYFYNPYGMYYLIFTGGDNLDSAKAQMFTNTNDSTIKTAIDNWYSTNLTDYTNYLENTIFCNDRTSASEETYTITRWDSSSTENGGALSSKDTNSVGLSYFKSWENTGKGTPSLQCTNINDRFSLKVDSGGTHGYGNSALTYPVGLLTSDEVELAGSQYTSSTHSNYYLYTGENYLHLSPTLWDSVLPSEGLVSLSGGLASGNAYLDVGVRPVVSLKYGTEIIRGTGTFIDPYIITE